MYIYISIFSFLIHPIIRSTTTSSNPLIIMPGQKGPSNTSVLPENSSSEDENESPLIPKEWGKMSKKKRKRLEKFMEKQFKKEEKVKLMEKLG